LVYSLLGDGLLVTQIPRSHAGSCASSTSLRDVGLRLVTRTDNDGSVTFFGRSAASVITCGPQVLFQEVLLRVLLGFHRANDIGREAVLDPAAAYLGNPVLRVRTTDLVGPLHLLGLDDHSANLGLAVLGGREGDDEVCTLFAVGLKKAALRVNNELRSRVSREEGSELSVALQMVVQFERDAGGLLERALDHNHIINLGLKRLKYHIELPAASTTLVDHKFSVALERTKRLKAHLEAKRVVWA